MKKKITAIIILRFVCKFSLAQWTKITLPSHYAIAQMQFVNDSVGYIIAHSIIGLSPAGKIYKTFDRGLHWFEKNFYYQSFYYMHFINRDTGWICMADGASSTMRRTKDGGNTWTNISFNAPHGPVHFTSPLTRYVARSAAGAQGAFIFKSTDGRITWSNTGINPGLSGIQDNVFSNADTAFVGGLYGPTLGKLDLLGNTYTTFSTSMAVFDIDYEQTANQIFFAGEEFGVNSGLYKTNTLGAPVSLIIDNATTALGAYRVMCKNSTDIICGGLSGNVALSFDGGTSWTIESTGSQTTFTDVYWGGDFALAAGGDGELYRRALPASIQQVSVNADVVLYPSPTHHIISVLNTTSAKLTTTIYDLFSKCLLSANCNQGKTEINISTLAAGFYIVQMASTDGKLKRVQKIAVY